MTAVSAHAETLEADARALTECADRLLRIEAELGDAAPGWFREAVHAHITACARASGDLAEVAARLRVHAAHARRRSPA
jgi:hypothetical protein